MTKNKIDARLEQCKAEGRKALITFITAGDGGYDCTEKAVLEMAEKRSRSDRTGRTVFRSDRRGTGDPVCQRTLPAERYHSGGYFRSGTPSAERNRCAAAVDDVPEHHFTVSEPTVFSALCEECGIDGVIVPDIPFEEK
mgnify:CR=1 FL=1